MRYWPDLGDYGLALGRAFQLRDDLLGVFAGEDETGKPAAGDLREGKRTVLLARVLDAADPGDRDLLTAMLGRADLTDTEIDRARSIIQGSGAVAAIEHIVAADHARAVAALDGITGCRSAGRTALVELARQCVERRS